MSTQGRADRSARPSVNSHPRDSRKVLHASITFARSAHELLTPFLPLERSVFRQHKSLAEPHLLHSESAEMLVSVRSKD